MEVGMSGFYEPPPRAASEFRERIYHPRWETIQSALGRPVPEILRQLYSAPDALLRSHFYLVAPDGTRRMWLDLFLPMDDEALRPYGRSLPPGAVAFADDEHGDPYYFLPDGSVYGDGPVFVRGPAHGPDGEEQVAGSLAEFLSWSRDYAH
jgi:hypothetical protein